MTMLFFEMLLNSRISWHPIPRAEVIFGIQPERKFIMTQRSLMFIPLSELVVARKFDRVNTNITDKLFPIPDRLWNDYREFHFGENIPSREAVGRMQEQGYEPANSHELLLWEEWNGKDAVVALGSFVRVDGNRPVLYLYRNWLVERSLYLSWWDGIWNTSCHFLAVRNPSGV